MEIVLSVLALSLCLLAGWLVVDARNRRDDAGKLWSVYTYGTISGGDKGLEKSYGPFRSRREARRFIQQYRSSYDVVAVLNWKKDPNG